MNRFLTFSLISILILLVAITRDACGGLIPPGNISEPALPTSISADAASGPLKTTLQSTNIDKQVTHSTNTVINSIYEDPQLHPFLISNWEEQADLILENKQIIVGYTKKYYEYQENNLNFLHNSYEWNGFETIFIFIIAHILLFLGVGAAYYEFRHAMRLREKSLKESEIKIDLEGIALKTSLRAIWLLLSAFVFYFLYVKFVYPITAVQ